MPKTADHSILDLIEIKIMKNGRITISFPAEKKTVFFKFIKEQGYAYTSLGKEKLFVQISEGRIQKSRFENIRTAFHAFLKDADYSGLPNGIGYHKVMESYYQNYLFKNSPALRNHLAKALNDQEIHELLLTNNSDYLKKHQNNLLLDKLKENEFKSAEDKVNSFHEDDKALHHKQIGESLYLVLNEMSNPKYDLHMFDCWICSYKKESDIGRKKPLYVQTVMLNFNWERDFDLIAKHIS